MKLFSTLSLIPYSIGFLTGLLCASVVILSRVVARDRKQQIHCADYWRAELGAVEPPTPPLFDVRMSNEEWADAMTLELAQRKGTSAEK